MSGIALSRRRVAKNALSQVLAFGLSGATKAIVAIVVARWLGPAGFGVFIFAWTVASMASFFSPLGLDYLLIRELNRSSGTREISTALPIAILSSVVLAAGLTIGSWLLASPDVAAAVAASSAFIVISAPVLIFRATFHARERMELETVALAVEGVVSLVAVAAIVSAGGGVPAALLGLGVGRAGNLLVSVRFYRRLFGPLTLAVAPGQWQGMLKTSIPMGVGYIFHSLMLRFDVVMLGMMRSPDEVGLYSAATVIIMTVPIISTAFNTSLFPVLARASGPDDPELKHVFTVTFKALIMFGLACSVGLTVLARPIVELFYGTAFEASIWVVAVLAWILPFRFVNNLSGVVLNATDKAGRRTLAVSSAAIFNILVNLAFIPAWGYKGAVVSTLITEGVLTVGLRLVLRPLSPSFIRPLIEGGAVAGLIGITVAFTPGHVFARTGIGIAAFGLLYASFFWARRFAATPIFRKEVGA